MRLIAAERLVLFCSLVLMACSQSGGVSSAPSRPTDESRTVREYIALGVPDPGREWSGKDVEQCAAALSKIPTRQLPRLRSDRSSALFRRMVGENNLARQSSRSFPLAERAVDSMFAGLGTSALYDKYAQALNEGIPVDEELVELCRVAMELNVVSWQLSSEIQWRDDAQRAQSQGQAMMRSGTAQTIDTVFTTFSETDAYRLESRRLLGGYSEKLIPKVWEHLTPESKRELKLKLEGLIRQTTDPALLRSFRTIEAQLHNPK